MGPPKNSPPGMLRQTTHLPEALGKAWAEGQGQFPLPSPFHPTYHR